MVKNQNIRLDQLFDRVIPASLLLYPILLALFVLYRIIPGKGDGWRKSTSVFHRRIPSRYIGSIKGLVLPDAGYERSSFDLILNRLHQVFKDFKSSHYAIEWNRWNATRIPWKPIDFVKVEVSEDLVSLKFVPDSDFPVSEQETLLIPYFESRIAEHIPGINSVQPVNWPFRLEKKLIKMARTEFSKMNPDAVKLILKRILSSVWISEAGSSDELAGHHFFAKNYSPGFGNFFCQLIVRPGSFDLWLQISHISMDGRRAVECMKRIIKAFGQEQTVPAAESKESGDPTCAEVSIFRQKFDEGITSVDLSIFLETLAEYESEFGRINPVALLAWCVSLHPRFSKTKFNIPVDIPMTGYRERSVGFVFIRPGYFQKKYDFPLSFEKYLSFFDAQFLQLRKRKGAGFIFADSAAVIHPIILDLFFKLFPNSMKELIGDTCLTSLKGIDIALPPLSDNIRSGIIFSFPGDPGITGSNIGVRSFYLNSSENLRSLRELFSKLNHFLDH